MFNLSRGYSINPAHVATISAPGRLPNRPADISGFFVTMVGGQEVEATYQSIEDATAARAQLVAAVDATNVSARHPGS